MSPAGLPIDGDAAGGNTRELGSGALAQEARSTAVVIISATRLARTETWFAIKGNVMSVLLLEALGALLLLVFIVWWTMFAGRKKGELKGESKPPAAEPGADDK